MDLGFDPISVSTHCYASSQFLEKVSVFDLRYNTKNNDWSKYALYEKDGEVYIVVNHSLPGVTYDLYYDYVDDVPLYYERKIKQGEGIGMKRVGIIGSTTYFNEVTAQITSTISKGTPATCCLRE
ncbi:hypothetical protein [Fictibacillus phosphorivorans]|uniref:hypothetical protein n=1 Tax=Fictibacillus phosphorivorans TaxID=1221500 RepID=UPI00203F0580|nr:hypothetical protein [Fictibacillus phosphorivorans]